MVQTVLTLFLLCVSLQTVLSVPFPQTSPCDGTSSGRCPHPVDCSKYFTCADGVVVGEGECPTGAPFFSTLTNTCDVTSDNCVSPDGGADSFSFGHTQTTVMMTTEVVLPECSESTNTDKVPYAQCSPMYYICHELANGDFGWTLTQCIGDMYFNPDPEEPYCEAKEEIDECQPTQTVDQY